MYDMMIINCKSLTSFRIIESMRSYLRDIVYFFGHLACILNSTDADADVGIKVYNEN